LYFVRLRLTGLFDKKVVGVFVRFSCDDIITKLLISVETESVIVIDIRNEIICKRDCRRKSDVLVRERSAK
jgi:hypothetical protein